MKFEKPLRHRIKDYRAVYGALALVLIGLVLTLQSALYVNIGYFGPDIITARWHWELMLNIQILCFAFMWFSHHNRILFSEGRWRVRAIANFIMGFLAVGMPLFLTILGAGMDWYRNPPGPDVTKFMIRIAVGIWLVSNFLIPLLLPVVMSRKLKSVTFGFLTFSNLRHMVAGLMVLLLLCNDHLPANIGYVCAPFLCFLHGGLVYLEKSFRRPPYDSETRA